jgi:hypothetical protein
MRRSALLIVSFLVVALVSCRKDDDNPAPVHKGVEINLSYTIDGYALLFDTIMYDNDAGNKYGVTRLHYYLSAFEFISSSGTVYSYDSIFYVDAQSGTNAQFEFPQLPAGSYTKLKFLIGLDSSHNVSYSLPNTVENANMAWPDNMGGGYHFMKLEGNFVNQQVYGFAMHLGNNRNIVAINIDENFSLTGTDHSLNLEMNLNEWFRNPSIYDFNYDGNYSMIDSLAMAKLASNGVDVFKIK